MAQRNCAGDDEDGARKDSSGSHTSDGTTDDQGSRVGRNTTDQRADLKDEKGDEVDPFDRVIGVEFAVKELCRTGGEQVSRAIPAYIVKCLELICDARNSCCNDRVVL